MFCAKVILFVIVASCINLNNGQQQQQQQQQPPPSQQQQLQQQQQPQQGQNIDEIIAGVFTTTPRARTTRRRGGFGEIVTPEPIVEPTSEPQIFENNGNRCTCVPYHLCDPSNQTIRDDGQFDGFGVIDIRFDSMSCQDVLDVCCQDERRQTTPIMPPPIIEKPNRPKGCGIRNVGGIDFNITGDFNNEAGFGEFPWTVALIQISNNECLCGGSLIHPQVVLTGNHCVRGRQPSEIKIRAGEWDTQTTKERLPYQEQIGSIIISHPSYNPRSLANDVALIVLDKPFQLADHINVICLPPQNYDSSLQLNCFASGWGKDIFGKAGKYSVIMKKVPLPIVPNDQCEAALKRTRLGSKFALDPSFLCAGGEIGVDTCQGDGGAPLVCPVSNPKENRYAQSGIVAWGIGCNDNHPAVYANVALARDWIDTQMRQLGFDTSVYTY